MIVMSWFLQVEKVKILFLNITNRYFLLKENIDNGKKTCYSLRREIL